MLLKAPVSCGHPALRTAAPSDRSITPPSSPRSRFPLRRKPGVFKLLLAVPPPLARRQTRGLADDEASRVTNSNLLDWRTVLDQIDQQSSSHREHVVPGNLHGGQRRV